MNGCVDAWMDRLDGWMDRLDVWMGGWMDGWMDECTHGCMHGWVDDTWMQEWMDGWGDRWIRGPIDEWWMGGRIDGWMDGKIHAWIDDSVRVRLPLPVCLPGCMHVCRSARVSVPVCMPVCVEGAERIVEAQSEILRWWRDGGFFGAGANRRGTTAAKLTQQHAESVGQARRVSGQAAAPQPRTFKSIVCNRIGCFDPFTSTWSTRRQGFRTPGLRCSWK